MLQIQVILKKKTTGNEPSKPINLILIFLFKISSTRKKIACTHSRNETRDIFDPYIGVNALLIVTK